jgi:phage shock protein PspC (stress-responsive transcriptional regulator)
MTEVKRLTRSEDNRMVAGVCGGLGEFFGVDPVIVRVVLVVLALFGGSGLLLYAAMWLIVTRASQVDVPPRELLRDSVDEAQRLARESAQAARDAYRRMRGDGAQTEDVDSSPASSEDLPGPTDGADEQR